jgi:hypothetical protein
MITYWCMKKNSIVNWIYNGVDFSPELIPCKRTAFPMWREGEGRGGCILHVREGEQGR